MSSTTPTTSRRRTSSTPDAVCAAAVDQARAAAVETAGDDLVGDHAGVVVEDERTVTHRFASTSPAYPGWYWAVTVTRPPRARTATVSEVVLLPGEAALLAPAWVPWSDRVKPGDLGIGDVLPTSADDPRLEHGYEATGDEDADQVAIWELGLGRRRVPSRYGRNEAADRWYTGEHGPFAPIAAAAPATCSTCGFFWPLGGSLRQGFGVCTNEISPSDGQVVSLDHGCGGHSEAAVVPSAPEAVTPIIDEVGYDVIALHPLEHPPGSIDESTPAEDLGHS